MSWYRDPQLFIYKEHDNLFYVARIIQEYSNIPMSGFNTSHERLDFSKHLSTGDNKESDFDAFKSSFPSSTTLAKFINNQGLVINWNGKVGTWSHEGENMPFYSLPGISKKESVTELLADKQALEEKISSLELSNSNFQKRVSELEEGNSILKAEVQRERDAKTAFINGLNGEKSHQKHEELLARLAGLEAHLEKQILGVSSKLEGCCGAEDGSAVEGPWMSGHTIPSSWVPFEELDVQTFSKNTTLTITKADGAPKFGVDKTTNVETSYFYRGMFPIVVVNVAELTPNREEARFDPDIWGSYSNAGISYAARKPFASEMSVDAHQLC